MKKLPDDYEVYYKEFGVQPGLGLPAQNRLTLPLEFLTQRPNRRNTNPSCSTNGLLGSDWRG